VAAVVDFRDYPAGQREFAVAQVTEEKVQLMLDHRCPLGFDQATWESFLRDLLHALATAGLDDADVRLQGSAARFFSSHFKPFPQNVTALLAQATSRSASQQTLLTRWRQFGYDQPGPLPNAHFFDSRLRLGLSPTPSDFDLQLSSRKLALRLEQRLQDDVPDPVARDAERQRRISEDGGHFKFSYVRSEFIELGLWWAGWKKRLGRSVSVACFSERGPEGLCAFNDKEDWRIQPASSPV
jgi:hypothetical protein